MTFWGIALAGAVVGAAAASATLGYRHGEVQRAERIVAMKPMFDEWRHRHDADALRIERDREDAAQWVREAGLRVSRMQARVVHLEALARRVVARTGLESAEFDFDDEPGIGGPEEALLDGDAFAGLDTAVAALSSQVDDRWMQLRVLEDVLKWRDVNAAVRPEGRPVGRAYVSSGFGPRIDPFTGRGARHKGIDFAGRAGTAIVAVAAGIVTWSGTRSSYGQMVEIDHGNELVTRYAHNSENLVDAGDVVTRGQPIALLGSTGRATGPNLHFEVLQGGEAVDPSQFIH